MEAELRARTGIERFMDKCRKNPDYWPISKVTRLDDEFEYLGVGAPMVDPTQFQKIYKV